jgi:hypothetical protein
MSPCLGLVQPKATLDLCTLASKGKIVIFGVIHHHFGNMSVLLYIVLPEQTVQSPMITVS